MEDFAEIKTKKTTKNENEYYCEICDFFTSKKTDYTRHLSTDKHKNNEKNDFLSKNQKTQSITDIKTKKTTKNEKEYYCEICDFVTIKKRIISNTILDK